MLEVPSIKIPMVALLLIALLPSATNAALAAPAAQSLPDFGPNVIIFDPSMPVSDIKATVDAIHAQQVDDEMGTNRYALLFKPGIYGTNTEPLQMKVGYYTEFAGLGALPTAVIIKSIAVKRANTVVLGLGHATLTAENGAIPLTVADVPGVILAGVTIAAGTVESPVLLQVGKQNGNSVGSGRVFDLFRTHCLILILQG